jgi:hypothetical protein
MFRCIVWQNFIGVGKIVSAFRFDLACKQQARTSRESSGFEWKPSQPNTGDTEEIHGRYQYEYPVSCPRFKAGRSRRSIESFTAT